MRDRYPRLWLFTDERLGDDLWHALRRLPPGAGVVFRHYSLAPAARMKLWITLRRRAQARRCLVISGRDVMPNAHGVHGAACGRGLRTWPAHDRREARRGVRNGAGLLFVSPVFATRSHPNAAALGKRAETIGRGLGVPVIALGGMNAKRWRQVRGWADGWAAIDAWR